MINYTRLNWNCHRIWAISTHDRRIRATLISYLIPTLYISLLGDYNFYDEEGKLIPTPLIRLIGLFIMAYILSDPRQYRYSCQAFILGVVNGLSISLGFRYGFEFPLVQIFCIYSYIFALFHFSEFFVTGLTNIESLRPSSFLLDHSTSYWLAASASWLEFLIEGFFFPSLYSFKLTLLGVVLCVVGELLRKLAMWQAAVGFTHQIAIRKQKNHKLVTNGVYGLCRHPGYLGWLLWSVGTQVVLCNPICAIVYAKVTYNFFDDRIHEEERYLLEFFGHQYIDYQQRVGVGIPGISGFVVP